MNHSRLTYATLLVAASLWCGLIILAPMLAASASPLAEYCYRFFQPVCHQRPERSFFLFGNQLGVCVRCTSVYFGFLLGVIAYPFVRGLHTVQVPSRWTLVASLAAVTLEVAAEWVGVYTSTVVSRSLTGTVLGLILAFLVVPVLIDGVRQLQQRHVHSTSVSSSS